MRQSQLFTKTQKESPADEISKNAELLIRGGFIHKEMAGVYAFLPLGVRVIEKIKGIIREEMNAIGGQEVYMTTLQPRDIWEKTDRWDDTKVDNWFKTKLKSGEELGVGLTHEEPIVDALSNYVSSYRDLPISVYQIQNKFRNELRAKSGILRGREFIMKDMYSFARTEEEHVKIYEEVAQAYHRVYKRLGIGHITYRTHADGGIFTKKFSDEFQTVSGIGEDTIYLDEEKNIAVNKEIYTDENLIKLGLDKSKLVEKRAIEVGNIFPLESKYTDALGVYFTDEDGKKKSIISGCYGIGVSRTMGVLAEIFSDDNGLMWPESVAPFQVHLLALGEREEVKQEAEKVYEILMKENIEVLFDDRNGVNNGEKFADADLLGMPYRLVISERNMKEGVIEVKKRNEEKGEMMKVEELLSKLKSKV
ncbi:prolyl-tRNA synthetase [Candidatus Nomurabacteria bacterium]|jgi:prolyl-tRNA synthetase|nr:MAG: prolyl-tRNA synthetase [Candidatus Nomurabacteria bacterium]